MKFDIQKFAEDEVQEYGDVLDGAIEDIPEDLPPIPKELEGIPEDIARDIMTKASAQNSETPDENPAPETPETESETSVPYKRFKETLEQKNDLAQQLAAYRERYGELSSQSPHESQPPKNDTPQQNFMPQFNADAIKQIDDAIKQRAMQISGLSKEEIDGIDYFDDDDPRISLWNHARELSKATVYNDIVANHIAQQQELQRLQYLQNQSVNDYNNFVAQRQAAENFDAVRQYATGEFFKAQSPIDKEIITESFTRLSRNMATPADMMIVRDFFTRAENSFANKSATPQVNPQKNIPQPKANFPRTNQLNGTAGSGGGVTQAQLADMLQNKKWSEIPPQYQKILLDL